MSWTKCSMCGGTGTTGLILALTFAPWIPAAKEVVFETYDFINIPKKGTDKLLASAEKYRALAEKDLCNEFKGTKSPLFDALEQVEILEGYLDKCIEALKIIANDAGSHQGALAVKTLVDLGKIKDLEPWINK